MKKKRMLFLRGLALTALALALLLDAAFLILPDRAFSPTENRSLQTLPAPSLSGIASGRFESRFDDYVADQFPLRDGWVRLKSTLDRLGGRTESGGVYLGKDGALIQDFVPPSEADYMATLEALRGFLARHGDLANRVMIAPTALSVYPERLPALAPAGDEDGYISRLCADLADAPAQLIDLREPLKRAKQTAEVYYRTDHHWTTDGAYAAYLALSGAAGLSGSAVTYQRRLLSADFQGTLSAASGFNPNARDDLWAYLPDGGVQYVVSYVGDNARSASLYKAEHLDTRDQYAVFLDGNHAQVKIETTAANGRVLLVLKDSYANCLIPFLVQDYEKLIVVDPRYFTGDLEVLMAAEGVNETLILYNAATLAADRSLRADL